MKHRRVITLACIGAAAVAVTIGGVFLLQKGGSTAEAAELTSYVTSTSGADGTGLRQQLGELMKDDAFRADLNAQRDKQQTARDAWWDKYGDDPTSTEARAAQQTLREAQRTEMNALLEKYGVDTSAMEQAREKAEQAREKIRELMSNDAFRADLNSVRDTQQKAMDAWWDKYGDDPTSAKAREAMQTLREDAGSAMKKLAAKYGVELPEGRAGFFGKRGGGMDGGSMDGGFKSGFNDGGLMGPGGGFGGGEPSLDGETAPGGAETTPVTPTI